MTEANSGITKRGVGLFFAKAAVLSGVFAFVKIEGEMLGLYLLILTFFLPAVGIPLFAAALAAVAGAVRLWQPFTKKRLFAAYTAGLLAIIVGVCVIVFNSPRVDDKLNIMRARYLAKRAEVILDCEKAGYSKLLDNPNITEDTRQLVLIDYDRMQLSFQHSGDAGFYLNSRENAQYFGYGVMAADGRLLTEEDKFLTGYHTKDIAGICSDNGGGIYLDQLTEYPMTVISAGDDPDKIYSIIG